MISHITLGTDDLDRATGFYAPVMQALGFPRVPLARSDPFIMWRHPQEDRPLVALSIPFDGQPHRPGNGQMLALMAKNRAKVDEAYRLAIEAGAQDEGAPGLRPHYHSNYYGAYFRDLDGNKVCIVCHEPEPQEN